MSLVCACPEVASRHGRFLLTILAFYLSLLEHSESMASLVHRLPPELVRKIGDHLIGIKQWATDAPRTIQTAQFAEPGLDVDFIGLRTLPSLATASRFFLEPALDALWDTLPDYSILVYLLPRDAWAVQTVNPGSRFSFSDDDRSPKFQYLVRIVSEGLLSQLTSPA